MRKEQFTLTRKDYVATAAILKNFNDHYAISDGDFITLVYDFVDMFAEDNPNFNENKFVNACGLDVQNVNV